MAVLLSSSPARARSATEGLRTGHIPGEGLGQDVPHELDLALLPRGAQPFLPHCGLDPALDVGGAQRGPLHASRFELTEKDSPGVLRLVEHGLNGREEKCPLMTHRVS